jgi:hypothetical protein
VDGQALLGAGEVADGKAAVGVAFGHLVPGPDVGSGGVDPQAEQAAGHESLLRRAYVSVRGGAVAVLKHLDADDQREDGGGWEGAEVSVDEAVAAGRSAVGELGDGRARDVQAGEIEAAGHERQVVAPVAAADVQTAGQACLPRGGEDVGGEGDRQLACIAAGGVFGVPRRGGRCRIRSGRHRPRLLGQARRRIRCHSGHGARDCVTSDPSRGV